MARQFRTCANKRCPSKKDSQGKFTKIGYKTDSKSAVFCPICRKKLPDFVPDVDPDEISAETADSNPSDETASTEEETMEKRSIKESLGGFVMKIASNWLKILFGVLTLGFVILFIVFFASLLSHGAWGIVALVGLGVLFLGSLFGFIHQFRERKIFTSWPYLIGIGLVTLILGLIMLSISAQSPTKNTVAKKTVATSQFSLGKPADPATIDNGVWNDPQKAAVMVDGNGTTVYTQSGKNGSVLLKGKIVDGESLVLDSYSLSKTINGKLESYSGGNLLVLVGPLDLDANPISYTDGAAQEIGTINLQKFLDENIWVKFSRGDRLSDNSAWSYKTWALSNIWLPDGYSIKKLGLTAATDTYPNK
jgi:uncharacterized membrane protein